MAYTIKKKVKKAGVEAPDIEEVRSLFSKVFEERRQAVLGALGVIAVLAIIGISLTVFRSSRVRDSIEIENRALAAFYDTSGSPDSNTKALELFKEADSLRTSALARLYTAEAYLKSGQTDRAEETFRTFVSGEPDAPLASVARLKLALIAAGQGRREEAMAELESLQKDTLVGDTALYQLASMNEEAGESGKKLELFKTLAAQFPKSPWASEAIRYIEESSAKTDGTTAPAEAPGQEASK